MNNLWENIPKSEKKTIPISNYKYIKYTTIPIKTHLNPNDFNISIEELEQINNNFYYKELFPKEW